MLMQLRYKGYRVRESDNTRTVRLPLGLSIKESVMDSYWWRFRISEFQNFRISEKLCDCSFIPIYALQFGGSPSSSPPLKNEGTY